MPSGIYDRTKSKKRPKHSLETRKLMSRLATGERNHRWGTHASEETRLKMRMARLGKKMTEESRKKLSDVKKLIPMPCGENAKNWRGGITPFYQSIRTSDKYKLWRESVFKRDGYACTWCGDDRGHNLNADHAIPFTELMESENIKTLEQAEKSITLWDLLNGRTLCAPCHRKTATWGAKSKIRLTKY